jgi:Alpha amylase, C-terminal all-beta domain
VGAGEGGRYRVVLDSDEGRFGGQGRLGHGVDHFTQPEGVPGTLLNWNRLAAWYVVTQQMRCFRSAHGPSLCTAMGPPSKTHFTSIETAEQYG